MRVPKGWTKPVTQWEQLESKFLRLSTSPFMWNARKSKWHGSNYCLERIRCPIQQSLDTSKSHGPSNKEKNTIQPFSDYEIIFLFCLEISWCRFYTCLLFIRIIYIVNYFIPMSWVYPSRTVTWFFLTIK